MFVTSGQQVGPFDSSGYMSLEDSYSYCKSLVTHAFQILQPRAKKYLQRNSITIPIFPIYFSIFVTCYVFFKEMGTTLTHGTVLRKVASQVDSVSFGCKQKRVAAFHGIGKFLRKPLPPHGRGALFFRGTKKQDTWGNPLIPLVGFL